MLALPPLSPLLWAVLLAAMLSNALLAQAAATNVVLINIADHLRFVYALCWSGQPAGAHDLIAYRSSAASLPSAAACESKHGN